MKVCAQAELNCWMHSPPCSADHCWVPGATGPAGACRHGDLGGGAGRGLRRGCRVGLADPLADEEHPDQDENGDQAARHAHERLLLRGDRRARRLHRRLGSRREGGSGLHRRKHPDLFVGLELVVAEQRVDRRRWVARLGCRRARQGGSPGLHGVRLGRLLVRARRRGRLGRARRRILGRGEIVPGERLSRLVLGGRRRGGLWCGRGLVSQRRGRAASTAEPLGRSASAARGRMPGRTTASGEAAACFPGARRHFPPDAGPS